MSEEKLNVSAIPSRILMSDVLKGVVADDIDPSNKMAGLAQNYVMVIVGLVISGSENVPIVGTLEGMMHADDDSIELEVKSMLEDGLTILKCANCAVGSISAIVKFFELQEGSGNSIRFESERGFEIRGARVTSIDYERRMCIAMLNMRKRA